MINTFGRRLRPVSDRPTRPGSSGAATALGLALAACLVQPAAAAGAKGSTTPVYATVTGPEVQALLQEWGYRAELGESNTGNPMIESAIEGLNFSIFFYGCDDAGVCDSLQYSSWFGMENPPTLDTINEWNRTKRFGSAWMDNEQRPHFKMEVNVDGGVTPDNLRDWLGWWGIGLSEFATFIGFR